MSATDTLLGDLDSFQDRAGLDYKFVRYYQKANRILCWRIDKDGFNSKATCLGLPARVVDIKTLKGLDIWDQMSEISQQAIDQSIRVVEAEVGSRMENVRKARKARSEYAHIPRVIRCSECDEPEDITPGVFVKKAGLLCKDTREEREKISTFMNSYKCSRCQPRRRGRERNPLYINIPRSTPCSDCGKDCVINAKQLYELTKGKKDAIDKYCKEYLCRSCNPDWGSWLKGKNRKGRGRKAKPENEGFPKKAKCISCDKEVAIVPDNIRGKAKILKVTVEHLLANYKCRSCGGVVPHKRRKKKV